MPNVPPAFDASWSAVTSTTTSWTAGAVTDIAWSAISLADSEASLTALPAWIGELSVEYIGDELGGVLQAENGQLIVTE